MERLQQLKNNLTKDFKKTKLEFEDEGRIGIIYLNAPKELNALSTTMRNEIGEIVLALDKDPKVKVILFMSLVERAFCAGADVTEFPSLTYESQLIHDSLNGFDLVMSNVNKPMIAAVNGMAFGGGLELALMNDIIVCREDSQFGFPEIKLGLIPGLGGTQKLAKIAGKVIATKYILNGEFFNAESALKMGLVTDIFKKESFKEDVLKLAKSISDKSITSLITAKKAIKKSEELGVTEGMKYERSVFLPLFNTEAVKEGVGAFRAKRKADFSKL